MIYLVILSTFALLIGLAVTYWLHNQYQLDIVVHPVSPSLASSPLSPSTLAPPLSSFILQPSALLSIIVPARNEASNIRRCVTALLAQTYPTLEVIVVDDRSTDATPQVLAEIASRDPRLRVIQGVELPPGWAGKPHALYQGVNASRGEWLCFVDADTFVTPDCLAAVYAAAKTHQADLFTIMTQQELGTFWEKAILPLVFTALSVGFSPRRVNDPAKPDAVANGQFIFLRRTVYEAVGGYAALHDRIVEDKAMAEQVKRGGYRLVIADGRDIATTRMYTTLAEIWEGWTKNIYLGLQDRLWLLLIGAIVGLLGALFLPFWLIGSLILFSVVGGGASIVIVLEAALLWAYLLYHRAQACRSFKIAPIYALTLPFGALVFTAMMFASTFKVVSGQGVTWRGRIYKTN